MRGGVEWVGGEGLANGRVEGGGFAFPAVWFEVVSCLGDGLRNVGFFHEGYKFWEMLADEGHFCAVRGFEVGAETGDCPFACGDVGAFAEEYVDFAVGCAVNFFEFLIFVDLFGPVVFVRGERVRVRVH